MFIFVGIKFVGIMEAQFSKNQEFPKNYVDAQSSTTKRTSLVKDSRICQNVGDIPVICDKTDVT